VHPPVPFQVLQRSASQSEKLFCFFLPAGSLSGDGTEKAFSGNVNGSLNEQRFQLRFNEMPPRAFHNGKKASSDPASNFIIALKYCN